MRNSFLMALVLAVLLATGCGRSYVGPSFGSKAMPGTNLQLCYVLQFDTYTGTYDETKRTPLFAILWKGQNAGTISSGPENFLRSIHGRSVSPPRDTKAAYALQKDYTLVALPLTVEEVAEVFRFLRAGGSPGFHETDLWKDKIQDRLHRLEAPKE